MLDYATIMHTSFPSNDQNFHRDAPFREGQSRSRARHAVVQRGCRRCGVRGIKEGIVHPVAVAAACATTVAWASRGRASLSEVDVPKPSTHTRGTEHILP